MAQAIGSGREVFAGRAIWHINSTARGGGVAEMLQSLLGYARGAGVDARWFAITAGPGFFEITKRIHNNLHGATGDGGPLGSEERKIYEAGLAANAAELGEIVRGGDVVFLHDPQPAGLARAMRVAGAHVVWRCHVGLDVPNEMARRAWEFLRPYVEQADSYLFLQARVRLGGPGGEEDLDRASVDRRLLAKEPGAQPSERRLDYRGDRPVGR